MQKLHYICLHLRKHCELNHVFVLKECYLQVTIAHCCISWSLFFICSMVFSHWLIISCLSMWAWRKLSAVLSRAICIPKYKCIFKSIRMMAWSNNKNVLSQMKNVREQETCITCAVTVSVTSLSKVFLFRLASRVTFSMFSVNSCFQRQTLGQLHKHSKLLYCRKTVS